jgi:predicted nucleic acid-binding protein
MRLNIPRTALVDTGYWHALFYERDTHHVEAVTKSERLLQLRYIIPWPVMYETFGTRLSRRPLAVRAFEAILKTPNAVKVDDSKYREEALTIALDSKKPHPNMLSAVDSVLRLMIDDPSMRIDCMYTFNQGDFQDICIKRNVQML